MDMVFLLFMRIYYYDDFHVYYIYIMSLNNIINYSKCP